MIGKDSAKHSADMLRGQECPRVLFVSVNPFSSTSSNGKTFASFFEGYAASSLAQLYFHRELPSNPVCFNYFRITDEDLLHDFFRPWRVSGDRVSVTSTNHSTIPPKTHTALKGSRAVRLLRQMLWTQVRLDNPKLLDWADAFAPQIVFFCGGDAAALYPKVSALADRYQAKLVFYITDDYVLPVASSNLWARGQRLWTRHVFKRLTARADLVLTIGQLMSRRYKDDFGFESIPVVNMVDVPKVMPEMSRTADGRGEPLILTYAGSFHSNRWMVLAEVAESVARLAHRGVGVRLKVFGPEPTAAVRSAVHRPPFTEYGGLLSPEELRQAVWDADVLVHVEADDPASMAVTALSISTKIPEYLASGRSILAIGPREVASIDYLTSNNVATVLAPRNSAALDKAIESLVSQPAMRTQIAIRAFDLALKNHEGAQTRRMLWNHMRELVR